VQAVTEAVLELLRSGQTGALATVVQVSGSTPQNPGARLLVRPGHRFSRTGPWP